MKDILRWIHKFCMEMDRVDKNWLVSYFGILGSIRPSNQYTFGKIGILYIVKDKSNTFWLWKSNNNLGGKQSILYHQYNFSSLRSMECKSLLSSDNIHQNMLHKWLYCSRYRNFRGMWHILSYSNNNPQNIMYRHFAFLMYHNSHNFLCCMLYKLHHLSKILHCNLNMLGDLNNMGNNQDKVSNY